MQAKGKPATAAEWRAKAQFAEIAIHEDEEPSFPEIALPAHITISGLIAEITLPRDYSVADLV
ncbi:hypothetical protein [Paenirhodobacter sp.]|uniref:hypothetical protein n=1 Tax=Paenirhodobacter sp. TaxID=1965326 RepID=UPI003B40AECE